MTAVRERVDRAAEQAPPHSRLGSLAGRLFDPVDIASLVFFRVAFGALMAVEVLRFFIHDWIQGFYVDPVMNFTYYGFDWVRPLPAELMVVHFAVLGVLAVMIMLGLWYRVATVLFFLGFTYVFLLDQAQYLNHFYLIVLFSFLMMFVPAHRAGSLDARRRPEIRSRTVPAWSLWILAFQMGVVYFFGGVAKINGDWLQAKPLGLWLSDSTDFPIIGPLFTEEWLVRLFAVGSLLLDLFAVPLLLWRRTRPWVFAALVVFHVMNMGLFNIGIFPWLAIAATTLFFPPDWPRRLLEDRRRRRMKGARTRTKGRTAVADGRIPAVQRVTVGLLCAYVAVQVLVPLRHFVYPGDVSWTEEGHRFSWHMMFRDKRADARFFVTPATGETFEINLDNYVADWQYLPMATRPYLTLQFAHFLADRFSPPEGPPVQVHAHVMASLNLRPKQLLIDPRVDLAQVEPSIPPADWIVPLGSDLEIPPPQV